MMDRLLKGTGVDKLESREDLENWTAERKVNDVVEALVAVGVPAAPINTLKEVVEDPHVEHRGMIVSVDHPDAGTVRSPNHPIKYSVVKPEMRRAAPLLGQHNEEVLTDLGYSENEIEELRMTKVIT
jgi:formyl-CoA transferase